MVLEEVLVDIVKCFKEKMKNNESIDGTDLLLIHKTIKKASDIRFPSLWRSSILRADKKGEKNMKIQKWASK